MRVLICLIAALAVMGLAFWAYRENYRTRAAMAELRSLQEQMVGERAALAVLNAEWAYLNRPDRLRALVEINFDRLGLLPLEPERFGQVDQVAYSPEPEAGQPDAVAGIPAVPEGRQ